MIKIIEYRDHSFLNEITRRNLVGKTKVQSKTRYNKRLNYHPSSYNGVDVADLLTNDIVVVKIPVGKYQCTVAFSRIMEGLKDAINKTPKSKGRINLQVIIKLLSLAFDKSDVLVDCTCPDFIYRFSFFASKYGYKYGKPENRPPKITNPNDNIGSVCKHLTALLSNKSWIIKVASVVNDFIRRYPEKTALFLFNNKNYFDINPNILDTNKSSYEYSKMNNKDSSSNIYNNEEDNSNGNSNSE